MDDEQIVSLYWLRNESAIRETEKKYDRYLTKIAYNILSDYEDSRESVNDTYLAAWSSMPPHRPSILSTYLSKLTRRISIDLLRYRNRDKRQQSQYALSLEELGDCISAGNSTEDAYGEKELTDAIAAYLRLCSPDARHAFVGRYYYLDSIREVAAYCGMTESKCKSLLHRTRLGLREYLNKEGFAV
ncbi:MAG: RNA polymerase sigma factor [Oscillospiraceae bacterium]|nr:RNA polymerase sigma factor [Oscillospiraceae bacterium]